MWHRLLNGGYEWAPPPAKSRQSDGERGARPLQTESCYNRRGHLCATMDRRLMDGTSIRSTRFLPPSSSDLLFLSPSQMSDAALDITSLVLDTLLLKCQLLGPHIGKIAYINSPKCIILASRVSRIVIFPARKHFSKGRRCIHLSHGALLK